MVWLIKKRFINKDRFSKEVVARSTNRCLVTPAIANVTHSHF
jgi:hypothetical protein